MRTVIIAADVADALGTEQVERLRGPEWEQRVQCWDCEGWLETVDPAAILLLRVVDLSDAVQFAVHAHPTCTASQMREVTLSELEARRQLLADVDAAAKQLGIPADANEDANVDVVATVMDTSRGSAFSAVLISHRADLLVGDGPDRVDGLVSMMLHQGWELFSDIAKPPVAEADGWAARFTHVDGHTTAPGVFELINPSGTVETSAYIQPARLWRPAIVHTPWTVVVQGSRFLADWETKGRRALKRAARAGLLVAAVVPVQLAGPGNERPPR